MSDRPAEQAYLRHRDECAACRLVDASDNFRGSGRRRCADGVALVRAANAEHRALTENS